MVRKAARTRIRFTPPTIDLKLISSKGMTPPMLAPNSDLAILLKVMGEYQNQYYEQHPEQHGDPTLVQHDWEFHERETGFGRPKIVQLLPQLVSMGLAFDFASHSKRGGGNPSGMTPYDGFSWISEAGQVALSQMRQPPPPLQVMISELGPVAETQLTGLLEQAAEAGVTKDDIRRIEDLLKELIDGSEEGRLEKATTLIDLLHGSKELTAFFLVTVLPFLHTLVPK